MINHELICHVTGPAWLTPTATFPPYDDPETHPHSTTTTPQPQLKSQVTCRNIPTLTDYVAISSDLQVNVLENSLFVDTLIGQEIVHLIILSSYM